MEEDGGIGNSLNMNGPTTITVGNDGGVRLNNANLTINVSGPVTFVSPTGQILSGFQPPPLSHSQPPLSHSVRMRHNETLVGSNLQKMAKANPKVFFDLTVGGEPAGRIMMELYADKTPKTAENFRALCTGEKGMGKCGKPLHYKGSIIDDIVVGSMWGGGDFIYGNADGSESIYGGLFEDENFDLKHDRPGVLSMANRGPDTNGSQFQIVLKKFPFIDGLHVVFGQVVEGLDVINSIGPKVKTRSGKPSQPVVIADCGQL